MPSAAFSAADGLRASSAEAIRLWLWNNADATWGSGVSTIIETAEQMQALGITPRNKVRFIFFSGEEQGLLGSDYYVSQLTKKQ